MDGIERNGIMGTAVALLLTVTVAVPVWAGVELPAGAHEPEPATYVTGYVISDDSPGEHWGRAWSEGRVVRVRDWRIEQHVEWSDPRLPREMVSNLDVDSYLGESRMVQVMAATYRLEDPDGAWTGTGLALGMEHGPEPMWLITLTGEGAHEGLSAMLTSEIVRADPGGNDLDQRVLKGVIVEGELPMPGIQRGRDL